MVGSVGPRQLAATLPYVDSWNTWWDWYGNTAEGFESHNAQITEAARKAGRDPGEVDRSACVYIAFDGADRERPSGDVPPLMGSPAELAAALRELAEAGADEAILVLDPITEDTVRRCGAVLAALDA